MLIVVRPNAPRGFVYPINQIDGSSRENQGNQWSDRPAVNLEHHDFPVPRKLEKGVDSTVVATRYDYRPHHVGLSLLVARGSQSLASSSVLVPALMLEY